MTDLNYSDQSVIKKLIFSYIELKEASLYTEYVSDIFNDLNSMLFDEDLITTKELAFLNVFLKTCDVKVSSKELDVTDKMVYFRIDKISAKIALKNMEVRGYECE